MHSCEGDEQARSTAEAVARRSYGKLVAFLSARTGDVAAAEDALSEAFAAALADWPRKGCPANPEAWLLTVARRKLIDMARRQHSSNLVDEDLEQIATVEGATPADWEIPDRRLALMFACAHPAIDAGIRAPLILQVILGLDAATIASAFLMSPTAMGKRLVRAKSKIREAAIPFRIPGREEIPGRLDTVLEAIYAAFSEGWSDAAGTDTARRDLTGEAFFLARLVTELMPTEPEALGLLALMLHAEARRRARRSDAGDYVPLADQEVARWDFQMIDEAEALLLRAREFQCHRPLSTRSRSPVGARASLPYGPRQLGSCIATLRRALRHHRLTSGGHQSRAGSGGAGRRACSSRGHARPRLRYSTDRIPALLGGARGAIG